MQDLKGLKKGYCEKKMKDKISYRAALFSLLLLLFGACGFDSGALNNFEYAYIDHIDSFDIIHSDLNFAPYEVGQSLGTKKKRPFYYAVRASIDGDHFKLDDPAILLGQIGDIDQIYFNQILIAKTGELRGPTLSHYHKPRLYRIPANLVGDQNELLIVGKKISILNAGIHVGPVKVANYNKLKKIEQWHNFLMHGLGCLLAFFSVMIGLYHLYLYKRIPEKRSNLYFFLFSFFSASFIYSISWGYAEWLLNPTLVVKIHGLSGILTAFSYLVFCIVFLKLTVSKWGRLFFVLNAIFIIGLLVPSQVNATFFVYNLWYPVGIGTIVYSSVLFWSQRKVRPDLTAILVASGIIFLCALFDVAMSLGAFSSFQISGIGFFALNIGVMISLAHDFTETYINVEKIVEHRTQDLSSAIEQLKGLEKMKQRLFANISHDLKTPIAVAVANLSQGKKYISSDGQKNITSAVSALQKLEGMVINILDSVKAESAELRFNWSSQKPFVLVSNWTSGYRALARNNKIEIQTLLPSETSLEIPIDLDKAERIFDNLMSNAIKFAGYGGRILVRAFQSEAQFVLEIEDSGPGIARAEWEKVFVRYYQGETTSLKDYGGSGIGLSFVKDVITAMKGQVFVAQGDIYHSKFVVKLPLVQDSVVMENLQKVSAGIPLSLKAVQQVPYPQQEPSNIDSKKPFVLVLEDNHDIAQIIYNIIAPEYNIVMGRSGTEGLMFLRQYKNLAAIITDLMMPEMSGTEFIVEVRRNNEWNKIPILVLTSKGEVDDVSGHLKLGANDYLAKPFDPEILSARLGNLVRLYSLQQKLIMSEKMASLGVLSAGISHEIKNPLGVSLNSSSLLQKFGDDIEKLYKETDDASIAEFIRNKLKMLRFVTSALPKQLNRINEIVISMQGYSSQSRQLIELNVHETIKESLVLLKVKIKEKRIKVVGEGAAKVLGYAAISQVFVNLFDNAIFATPEGGDIFYNIEELDETNILITISDTGMGIEAEDLNNIFDMFHTTKAAGVGTGLGLYISKDIVDNVHGGSISVESEVGKGTTFTIKLPKKASERYAGKQRKFHGEVINVT